MAKIQDVSKILGQTSGVPPHQNKGETRINIHGMTANTLRGAAPRFRPKSIL